MDQLREMGFSDADVTFAVDAAHGDMDRAIELLLDGNLAPLHKSGISERMTRLVLGISQYSFGDVDTSACTAIACTALPRLLACLDSKITVNIEILSALLLEGIETHRSLSTSLGLDHMGVEDIIEHMPHLKSNVTRVSDTIQKLLTTPDSFENLLQEVVHLPIDRSKHIGIIITKPPETILLLIDPNPEGKLYLFDSHARPQLGCEGAYFVGSSDHREVIRHFYALFPVPSVSNVQTMSLMEQMYYSFDAMAFQRK